MSFWDRKKNKRDKNAQEKNINVQEFQEKDKENLEKTVHEEIKKEDKKPFVVSIMGQTGVGKSSLVNALFNTKFKTDPVQPCTKKIESYTTQDESGHELHFYDLPGIGESFEPDQEYLKNYRKKLEESDVVIWAVHIDNRAVVFDLESIAKLLDGFPEQTKNQLLGKIAFVMTKADLINPRPWIFIKRTKDDGLFTPGPDHEKIFKHKSLYYRNCFLSQYKNLITSETYCDSEFDTTGEINLNSDKYIVRYHGLLEEDELKKLIEKYPDHKKVFERLYQNQQFIPCSSKFKYNLAQLMRVIVDKLGSQAIGRFSNFVNDEKMNNVSLEEAKKCCNIVIMEENKEENKLIFDLTEQDI
ncbi:50S ribosome-binding GTPase [Spirulina sp. CS-785/01]|uniref:GTPase family protein n=1 Tax=Spirulina sp. CS-785/01 TaxID=3021716 RepID=UPI0023307A3D|nr:GTPase [Spirulina sp. CS-785/01]MDB9314170.1 50S ribosome-binding GTPase [Spirulina sp. CS-785/01]